MNETKNILVWDLDKLFPNGSRSSEFLAHLNELESKISEIEDVINILNSSHEVIESLKLEFIINKIAVMRPYLSQANSFITCLLAQNSNDKKLLNYAVKSIQ